jgi:protein-S-isoprenylcysteine O-methyltransferase Ste14
VSRVLIFAYGVVCYALFLAVFLYSIAFIGNFGVVPTTLDSPRPGPIGTALAVDLALLSLFALQHSGMARPGFKRVFTRIVPEAAERSTYVLLSSICLALLYAFWQPIGGTVWEVTSPGARLALWALYFAGWGLVLYATFLIDHFDLFGLRQVWLALRGRPSMHDPFRTPSLYRHVRHPLYVGWFIVFWAAPVMSVGHLVLALVTTAYILVAVVLEERDLVARFGDTYRRYQESTPKFLPRLGGRRRPRPARTAAASR